MHGKCAKCNATCCRYFCLEIDKPETYEDFENIRWYLLHEGASVHVEDDGDWCLLIENACKALVQTPTGPRCADYENRPLICRKFSPAHCEGNVPGDYDYQELFRTPEQIEAYARKTLGESAFGRARARANRKAEAKAGKPKRKGKAARK